MFSYECLYRTKDRKAEPTPYDSKWIIEFKPLEVIYVPEVFQNLIDFVSFMEEHKNLRKTVQDLQSSVTGYLKVCLPSFSLLPLSLFFLLFFTDLGARDWGSSCLTCF